MFSLLALCAASSPQGLAAQTTPDSKPAASKASGKKRRTKKPAARTVRKPPAQMRRLPVRKPPPPSADIPTVVESASVWRGCLESHDLPKLASSLGMEQARLAELLAGMGSTSPVSQSDGCIAYVAATGGEGGVASVIFRYTEPGGESRTLAFHKTPDGIITTPGVCDCRESARRVLSLPAWEFTAINSTSKPNSVSASIPSNVRWQLDILVPRMMAGLSVKRTTEKESANPVSDGEPQAGNFASESQPEQIGPRQSEAPIDSYMVRVVVGRYGDDEREQLESVEIVEQVSGRRVNGAWWLDRPDGPGVIIGMDGVAYERLLWESPVKYVRSARGVGASVTTLRRRVPAKKGSAKSTVVRTIKVPGYHLGVDMTAAKGTDVHAVGDAKVGFAGRRRGFGNLIILDHGRGYQTYYAHLSKIEKGIKAGVHVARGDMIGLVGSTGRSTGPHLHFETRKDARYLDPFDETRQLGFWLLTADEQERLAMQLLSAAPVVADEDLARR
jgi:murein DD-endopeptidase MepM/ murein hydrolase activator NlpD